MTARSLGHLIAARRRELFSSKLSASPHPTRKWIYPRTIQAIDVLERFGAPKSDRMPCLGRTGFEHRENDELHKFQYELLQRSMEEAGIEHCPV